MNPSCPFGAITIKVNELEFSFPALRSEEEEFKKFYTKITDGKEIKPVKNKKSDERDKILAIYQQFVKKQVESVKPEKKVADWTLTNLSPQIDKMVSH